MDKHKYLDPVKYRDAYTHKENRYIKLNSYIGRQPGK